MARAVVAAAVVTFALAVLQTTLGGKLSVWGVSPDLLLVWTLCLGLQGGPEVGAIVGFGSGALQGSLGQSLIGPLSLSKMAAGVLAGLFARRLFRDYWLVPALCAALLTVVAELLFLLLLTFSSLGHPASSPLHLLSASALRRVALRALYHALLTPPACGLVARSRRALLARRGLAA